MEILLDESVFSSASLTFPDGKSDVEYQFSPVMFNDKPEPHLLQQDIGRKEDTLGLKNHFTSAVRIRQPMTLTEKEVVASWPKLGPLLLGLSPSAP